MSSRKLPQKWQSSARAAKAVQVAFDMEETLQYQIRRQALDNGLSPSDQIRHILTLPVANKPKRPRLTVSLSAEDYVFLAERYGLQPSQQLEIKHKVMDELLSYSQSLDE
ncbi:hypothetical protein GCM10011502_05470 [Oceanisphaera marina]|uniref:Ribbon-helix-helix protein CopG domain-containing protein n=1 Tax=Oceanisphaera marina TaxID=2017550 RepID=A0ABQ1IEG5_9GAMM|nr:hypothetical protein [Oceanisphaera marina]GGB35297.1 hypothetical protein GCM10011502_05470 [Oceanisphaera marina]